MGTSIERFKGNGRQILGFVNNIDPGSVIAKFRENPNSLIYAKES